MLHTYMHTSTYNARMVGHEMPVTRGMNIKKIYVVPERLDR